MAVCGVKNSGKTTLTERILRELGQRGQKAAVLKHDGHDFTCDVPGTDSFRYVEAGACGAAVFSGQQLFVRKRGVFPAMDKSTAGKEDARMGSASGARDRENASLADIPDTGGEDPGADRFLRSLAGAFPEADVILLEGGKALPVPKLEVVRSGVSRRPVSNPEGRFLLVSDLPEEILGERTLPFSQIEKIVDLILSQKEKGCGGQDADPAESESDRDRAQDRAEKSGEVCLQEEFTHFDAQGRARMVDVGEKAVTHRTALAEGRVRVNARTFSLIKSGGMKKGDVLGTAQIAGIMGAKRTPDLIPMCHPLFVTGIKLDLQLNEADCAVDIRAEVSCEGKTGVEMEALTAVSTAALTVYDMCKAVQRDIEITDIHLVRKTGGAHGLYERNG